MTVRVLVVDHTSVVSGGGRSLLDLLAALSDDVDVTLACPDGPLRTAASELGVPTLPLRGTAGSLRLHPVHSTRAVLELGAMAVATARHARAVGAQVVHANSIRAGLIAVAARRLGAPGAVVHLRDVLPPGRVSGAVRGAVGRGADALVAISRYVAEAFSDAAVRARMHVVHNGVDLRRFAPDRPAGLQARAVWGIGADQPLVAVVGQITPWKGQLEAIEAFATVHRQLQDARLAIVGEPKFVSRATRYDNVAYARRLRERADELGLGEAVLFTGERDDIPEVFRASDIALTPSWEEPFGRTIVEAMACGTPVIATAVGGPPEIVRDGVDGVLVEPRNPGAWAGAMLDLLADERGRATMGERARERAEQNFGQERHAAAMRSVYLQVARGSD
jgi:glycosyltransferase involved in cell wall biosynthesis